jgi:hypothetical protein
VSEAPYLLGYSCWVLWVDDCARIVEIDSIDDYLAVIERYGTVYPPSGRLTIDFERLANDFDGLHLTESGVCEVASHYWPYFNIENLYGWDVESTLWFRWVFKDVRHISEVPHTCKTV